MTRTLYEPRTGAAEADDASTPSAHLSRVLEEVEQAMAPREEAPQHPIPATTRPLRLFASD